MKERGLTVTELRHLLGGYDGHLEVMVDGGFGDTKIVNILPIVQKDGRVVVRLKGLV